MNYTRFIVNLPTNLFVCTLAFILLTILPYQPLTQGENLRVVIALFVLLSLIDMFGEYLSKLKQLFCGCTPDSSNDE
jgi:hypothetical protein